MCLYFNINLHGKYERSHTVEVGFFSFFQNGCDQLSELFFCRPKYSNVLIIFYTVLRRQKNK